MRNMPECLVKNYTCCHTPIEEHYNSRRAELSVERAPDFHDESESFHIAEIKRIEGSLANLQGKGHRDALHEIHMHVEWLQEYWRRIGLPNFIFWEGNKCGLKNVFGDITIPPVYDEIKLDYDGWNLFFQSQAMACKGVKWGVVLKDESVAVPFEYDDIFGYGTFSYVVKKDGKFGIVQYNPSNCSYEIYVECEMDNIFHHIDVMGDLVIFEKNGKYGWKGCQFPENDSEAEYDAVYLPTEEYFSSDDYDDEICSFFAEKNGKFHEIEWFTTK